MSLTYFIGLNLAKLCLKTFARVEVHGREWVPRYGPLLVVSNHLGNVDVQLISTNVSRQILFLAKRGFFKWPVVSSIFRGLGCFPINRDGQDLAAIRWTLRQLAMDKCVGIFPEGSRSRNTAMRKGSEGVAYIALKSQAPILPIAVWGSEKIPALWRMAFPFARLNMRIGQPFTLPVIEGRLTSPILEQLADMVMQRVAVMLPQSYRGYYAVPGEKAAPLPPSSAQAS